MSDSLFLPFYVGGYAAAMVLATWLAMRRRDRLSLWSRDYRRFLLVPWKVVTFAIAAVGMTVIAPYTGDPTWDFIDATFMSLLTFVSAPWAVGTLYRWLRGGEPASHAYVALCLWLFSASWSYDLYIWWRDGSYPITWSANLFASSVLYVAAGLLWNLERQPARGVVFAFMATPWPAPASEKAAFRSVLLHALPFMLLAAACVGYFFQAD